jgi:hypothetical protein
VSEDWTELRRLLPRSEEELLLELDRSVFSTEENLSGMELLAAVEEGRRWFLTWLARNKGKVCKRARELGLLDKETIDDYVDASAIADIILSFHTHKPTVVLLAALIAKHGLANLCGGVSGAGDSPTR